MKFPKSFENEKLSKKWIELKKIRDICNISIEEKRASKEIGSSLEASLTIELNKSLYEVSNNIDFSELCITSSVTVEESDIKEVNVKTNKAEGEKCPVCWKISKKKCERH
jgi:isoleucyl-tRNA synthetase